MPFKIDCKCGRTYTVEISSAVNRGNCNACNELLYVDRSIGKVETHKGEGWLMTNKYYVPREMTHKIGESI